MSDAGSAVMGIGRATGENRAKQAAERAISSPMLETSMEGAKGVLLSVSGPSSMTLHEATEAARVVADHADTEADIIFGAIVDDDLGEEMKVTVIAAGFERRRQGRPATSRPSTRSYSGFEGGRRPRHPDLRPGMNQPPGVDGAAFTDATDGDQRNDLRCAVRGVVLVGDLAVGPRSGRSTGLLDPCRDGR